MKALVWRLVALSNEACRLENEKKCVVFRFGPRAVVGADGVWVWVGQRAGGHECAGERAGAAEGAVPEGACAWGGRWVWGGRLMGVWQIVAAFPEGWMSSGQISREGACRAPWRAALALTRPRAVSSMKKRLEKEAMEHEA